MTERINKIGTYTMNINHQQEWTGTCHLMDDLQKHYTTWKEPDQKRGGKGLITKTKFTWNIQNKSVEKKKFVVGRDWEKEDTGGAADGFLVFFMMAKMRAGEMAPFPEGTGFPHPHSDTQPQGLNTLFWPPHTMQAAAPTYMQAKYPYS